ncbi:Response regulator 7 [Zostera marina]|uniref:Response regulator 7 n=1 Tax=Zostera marina TaxID=29655 RepID=A0A0K9NMG3_ZOSMR|nr:Response regulator 7 [Zostera marina]
MEEKKEEMEMVGKSEVKKVTKVLVVDDSSLDRKIVERLLLLSRFQFQVTTVDSGEKALDVLGNTEHNDESLTVSERKFDIVLTDYCMPKMDGYQLLKKIKEHSSFSSIPVVIMSSENDSQRITKCKAIGAEDFLIKPIRASHLQKLRNYAMAPEVPPPKSAGTKRKLPPDLDVIPDGNDATRRPHLAGVAVA